MAIRRATEHPLPAQAFRAWPSWLLLAAVMPMIPSAALAQSGPGLRFGYGVDGQTSYVVNSRLGGREGGELVTEVRPGFSVASRTGRVVGSLSYGLTLRHRSRNDQADDDVQHSLTAQFSAEAIERWMFVDAGASISQQLKDPYGARGTGGSAAGSSNRQEVATASLSPYVRGLLGGRLSYEVRLNASGTNARDSITSDSSTWGGSVSLSGQHGLLGWGLQATSQETDYRASRSTRDDRVNLSANWIPDPDWVLTVRGGEESTDVGGTTAQRTATWGGGVTWRPSTRTRLQFSGEKRYFGDSYSAVIEHRMHQVSFSLVSSRSDSGTNYGSQPAVTALQLQEALMAAAFPDPALRQQAALAFLQSIGRDPSDIVVPAFVNTAVSVIDSHSVNFGYSGRGLSFGAQAYMTKSRIVDSLLPVPAEPVEQRGWNMTAGYQLGPEASVSLSGGLQETLATATRAGTKFKTLQANLGMRLGRNATASFGARYSVFNSINEPYREAAITAALGYRF